MKKLKRIIITIGLFTIMCFTLTSCGKKKTIEQQEAEYGIGLEDKARENVDNMNNQYQNADDLSQNQSDGE
jgi:hypothetical protein